MTQNMVCKLEHSAFAPSQGVEGLRSTMVKSEILYLICAFAYPCKGGRMNIGAGPPWAAKPEAGAGSGLFRSK